MPQAQQPPAKFVLDEDGRRGMAVNSMVTGGCIISGAYVTESLLSTDARIEEGSRIENTVILPSVSVGRRCLVRRAIVDENCVIHRTHILSCLSMMCQRQYLVFHP